MQGAMIVQVKEMCGSVVIVTSIVLVLCKILFVFISGGEVYPARPCFDELRLCFFGLMYEVFHDHRFLYACEPFCDGRLVCGTPFEGDTKFGSVHHMHGQRSEVSR